MDVSFINVFYHLGVTFNNSKLYLPANFCVCVIYPTACFDLIDHLQVDYSALYRHAALIPFNVVGKLCQFLKW